ncbi:hypothetical protein CLV91_0861 [Maribacter vaceletii]|uniref:Subunit length determinant protein n=1 Tax=Maribacter vaceletii TaxID=1206816 RepID=A0A495ED25_9FLAO|nr:hypothetical protein [Maribacter vaceletii]RKR14782.1 hypothetical protein CLV91_0861 [Maribacter vaceletii]
MEEKSPTNNTSSDEIDLGQLFELIKKGFHKVFIGILRVFLYFKKNLLILVLLGVVGVGLGYGLKQISTITKKTEVIVKPNFESKDYLYGIVNELQSKIKGKDNEFYSSIGIDLEAIKGFKIEIEPVQESNNKVVNLEESLKYLEYLGNLKDDNSIKQVVKNEVLASSYVNHKISFLYKDAKMGQDAAEKIISYINKNKYFQELKEIYLDNAESQIRENEALVKQIDLLVTNYTKALGSKNGTSGDGMVLLGGEEGLDIPQLLNLKNKLIETTGTNKLEIKEQQETIKILNFGGPQQIKQAFFTKGLVLIPSILIFLFFVWSFIKYLNKKTKELL